MCAAKGLLPGQGSRAIKFARAPKTVSLDGYPRFGECSGYTNRPCSKRSGFANDDIYYLEVRQHVVLHGVTWCYRLSHCMTYCTVT